MTKPTDTTSRGGEKLADRLDALWPRIRDDDISVYSELGEITKAVRALESSASTKTLEVWCTSCQKDMALVTAPGVVKGWYQCEGGKHDVVISLPEASTKSESLEALAGFAKRLRQAKREYFADDPVTLTAITPFDSIAYDMEKLIAQAKAQGEPKEMRADEERSGFGDGIARDNEEMSKDEETEAAAEGPKE